MGNRIDSHHTVMITGGGGYLGSRLAEKLSINGCNICLVDIKFNDLAVELSEENGNIYCKSVDLKDDVEVVALCEQVNPHFIFHFASLINRDRSFSIYDNLYEVNVKGTLNLMKGLKDVPYLGFYFSSTSEVYGNWNGVPFHEGQQLHPMSPYSLTKLYSENLLRVYSEINKKPYKIFRIFNYFGPDLPDSTFVGQMIRSYTTGAKFQMTRGEQARDIIYIDDLLSQIDYVVTSDTNYSVFNICSGKSIKMVDIAGEFKKITNGVFEFVTNLPYRVNEVWETKGDNTRIKSLGFQASASKLGSLLEKCIDSKH